MPRLDATRQIGVTEQTFSRWKKTYGGTGTEQLKDLKRLQSDPVNAAGSSDQANNERPRKAVSDLTPGAHILKEAARGNSFAIVSRTDSATWLIVPGAEYPRCAQPGMTRFVRHWSEDNGEQGLVAHLTDRINARHPLSDEYFNPPQRLNYFLGLLPLVRLSLASVS